MPIEVIMPKVDMDMASGKVMTWHVAEGQTVTKGAPLFDIETDKAAMEVEASDTGILHHTTPEGTDVPIGSAVAWLYAEGEDVGDPPASNPDQPKGEAAAPKLQPDDTTSDGPVAPPQTESSSASDKVRATPLARSLARDEGVQIDAVSGTGPQGRVQVDDVRAILTRSGQATAPVVFTPEIGELAITRSTAGTGTPIVLIHGFASDATSWAPLEAHLKHRRLIRIDLPGHGKSPKMRIAGFAKLAKLVRQTFDALQIETAHLIGHSLGGALSLALADTRPKSVSSLTLISPAGLGPDVNGSALGGICKASRAESLAPWLKTLVADEALITQSYVRLAMAAREDPNLRAAQTALADVLFPDGVQAFDLRAALGRIDVPTRLIWGKSDEIIPWRHALRAPGGVALHLFEGVGHMPQFEASEAVGKLLKGSL
ncbi:acetoin dehydrogenase dihydrolipoyllysine-residue acetyltransferase subunit [Octadecabacter sp.]|nr:acetoin dehydrogenase dihydrolipoyllysine-residue acetyltransferase subunit [Octadecabacter sp.]